MFMNYKLDPQYPGPIYKQIAENISRAIVDGQLPAGCKLPTVRELSAETLNDRLFLILLRNK